LERPAVDSRHLQPARLKKRISGAAIEIPEQSSPLFRLLLLKRGLGRYACARRDRSVSLFTFNTSGNGRGTAMAFSPFKFLQEVRSETNKVTWPTRRETMITTIMVFVMVALASIFFFASDQIIRYLVTLLLGIH
jgi:preprotein translocase subunit SecE